MIDAPSSAIVLFIISRWKMAVGHPEHIESRGRASEPRMDRAFGWSKGMVLRQALDKKSLPYNSFVHAAKQGAK